MKRRELSRRGFLKGLGLSVVAGVLGIRPKAVSDSIRTFENVGGVWYEGEVPLKNAAEWQCRGPYDITPYCFAPTAGYSLQWDGAPTGDILEVTDEPLRPDECTLEANTLVGFDNVSGPWINVPGPYRRTTYYVNPCMGCDGNDGTTPRGAFRTLQRADAACVPGDTVYVGCADGIIQKC